MEDCLMEVLLKCLEKNVVISMLAFVLTMMTLMMIPEEWYNAKWISSRFEIFIFSLYYLIILFIKCFFRLCIKLICLLILKRIGF